MGHRRQLAFAVVCLVVATLLHLRFVREPLERDEGAYAYIGWRMLAGEIPYRDVFDHKPPGVHLAYALAFAAAGPTETTVRLLGALAGVLATLACGFTAGVFWGPRERLLGLAIATPLLALPQFQTTMANTEIFLAVWVAVHAAWTWHAARAGHTRLAFAAGVAAGIAALFKPVAGVSLVAAMAFEVLAHRDRGAVERAVAQAAGFAAPWLSTLAVFSWLGGGSAFVRDVFAYNLAYASGSRAIGLDRLVIPLVSIAAVYLLLAASGLVAELRRAPRGPALLGLLWLLGSLVGVAASGRYYPHYFIQAFPPLAVLGAAGVLPLVRRRETCLVLALLGTFSLARETRWFLRSPTALSEVKYGGRICLDARALGLELRRLVPPGSTVLVWGAEPQIYFYSRTRCPPGLISTFAPGATSRRLDELNPAAVVVAAYAPFNPTLEPLLAGYELVTRNANLALYLPRGQPRPHDAVPEDMPL